LAKQFGATITLVHILELPRYGPELGYIATNTSEVEHSAKDHLTKLARRAMPIHLLREVLVRSGSPFDCIASIARESEADLIVITTHGYTGLKHVLMGSTAERVVRHAPCPVLVVR
jgi:nucleotide-binding universal stress UspA family protein